MAKRADFKKWQGRLTRARAVMRPKRKRWKKSIGLYEAERHDDEEMQIPYLFSVLSTRLPTLFAHMPKINAIAYSDADIPYAAIMERIIEEIADETDMYTELFWAIYSALVTDIGFVKIGYSSTIDEYKIQPYEETKTSVIFDEYVTQQGVWTEYVKNEDMILDPEAKRFESCEYMIHRLVYTKNEFENNFGKIDVSNSGIVRSDLETDRDSRFRDDKELDRYEVFEIWDKPGRRRMVISEGHDGFLQDEPWPYRYMEGYPFEAIVLSPKLDSIEGINETLLMSDPSKLINRMISMQEENAETASNITLYEEDAMDKDDVSNFAEPAARKLVKVNDINRIKNIQLPPVPPEIYAFQKQMERLIEGTSHVSAQARQVKEKGRQTAREIAEISQAGNILTQFKNRQIERFVERVVKKEMALVKQYDDIPKKVRHIQGGIPIDLLWTGTELGKYKYKVRVGSAAHRDKEVGLYKTMQALEQLGKFANTPIVPNHLPLTQHLLRNMFDLLDISPEIVDRAFEVPTDKMIPQISAGQGIVPNVGGPVGNIGGAPTQDVGQNIKNMILRSITDERL
jgi:hypothetical protein